MIAQRALLRSARRLTPPSPVVRSSRRSYSTQGVTEDNAFNRERTAVKHHAAESAELWRKLSLYVVIPAVVVASVNAYTLWNEHWEHMAHSTPKEEKPQYDYLNIRNKAFPWGDGDKTAFWNDEVNYHKKD